MAFASDTIAITEVLKDYIIIEEGRSLFLECKLNKAITFEKSGVSGGWYKDSTLIISGHKIKFRSDGPWQMLEVKCVTKEDEGIYFFAVKAPNVDVYTKCVVNIQNLTHDNITYYFSDPLKETEGVRFHLRDGNISEGEKFVLYAEFSSSIQICKWYKYNRLIPAKNARSLLQDVDTSLVKLYIDNAEKTDSGIYTVVAKTYDNKYLSSFANIVVGKDFVNTLLNNETIPHIWQAPNDTMEVFDMDDVTLLFKVSYDMHTIIEWTKDGAEVKLDDRILCETYGNQYIALKLIGVTNADSGKYYLILRHTLSSNSEISSAELLVKNYTFPRPSSCVVRSLKSIITSVGNGVTFSCSFEIPETKIYTYVVWIVGHNKIEKSSQTFKVICNGSDFILHIPTVTPEMSGEVICQLRQHLPSQSSILLSKTKSHLTVVPPQVIEEEKIDDTLIQENNVHCGTNLRVLLSNMNSAPKLPRAGSDIIMYFKFCKTSGPNFFFELIRGEGGSEFDSVNVYKKVVSDPTALFPTSGDWNINWTRPNKKEWYTIEMSQENEKYFEIGICSSGSLDIKEPPVDKLFKFRIRILKPRKKRISPNFCFVPNEVSLRDSITSKEIIPFRDYKKSYSNDVRIGQGTFGIVNLVHHRNGENFSTKVTKFVDQSNWGQARREFNIMKSLRHPNTVELVEGYARKNGNGMIYIMEYLWGGELIESTIDRENLSEVDVIIYIRQLFLALEHLHSKNIVHLDIKPENIICLNRNGRMIKLIDFGMARTIEQPVTLSTMYGSHDFVAPEMIHKEPISSYCDMWSAGVLTYWLLTGRRPFVGSTWLQQSEKISQVIYEYDDALFRVISDRAKTFVSYLLRRGADDRMNAVAALNNEWITQGPDEGRPKKVPVRTRGGIVFVEIPTKAEKQWRILGFVTLAIVRLRARRLANPYLGRRFSARLLSARRKGEHSKENKANK